MSGVLCILTIHFKQHLYHSYMFNMKNQGNNYIFYEIKKHN